MCSIHLLCWRCWNVEEGCWFCTFGHQRAQQQESHVTGWSCNTIISSIEAMLQSGEKFIQLDIQSLIMALTTSVVGESNKNITLICPPILH